MFELSIRLSVRAESCYFINPLGAFHQIFIFGALRDKCELIGPRFRDRKVTRQKIMTRSNTVKKGGGVRIDDPFEFCVYSRSYCTV